MTGPVSAAGPTGVNLRSVSECREQYEALRSQALQPTVAEASCSPNMDLAFIERQGLVAWIERGPENHSPATERAQAKTFSGDLVVILADLVVGQPEEAQDGR